LIIDDEEPQLRQDLEGLGFAITWAKDIDQKLQQQIESGIFDLILLDFAGVGASMGPDQGLDILRHVKRVCPAVIVLAYTSKSLDSSKADFYIIADGVLPKDAGIKESLEKVEEALRKAMSPANLWKALLAKLDIRPGSNEEKQLERRVQASNGSAPKKEKLINWLSTSLDDENTRKAAVALVGKLLTLLASVSP
jgi:CheY-like chemotaxis protein